MAAATDPAPSGAHLDAADHAPTPAGVEVLGRIGPAEDSVLVLYTGGTIGMSPGPHGSLVPLDLRELATHLPVLGSLPVGLTVASFTTPVDSSSLVPADWLRMADTVVRHGADAAGVVILHGTDTMAYTASALSFLLDGLTVPVVLTGAQRPVTAVRTDGRENLVTSIEIASAHLGDSPNVAEVTVFFDDVLLRGNRTVKVHADSYHGFDSPNFAPLATAGVSIDYRVDAIRAPGRGGLRRTGTVRTGPEGTGVAAIRLYPGLDPAVVSGIVERPGLRALVVEAYGAGNGSDDPAFLDAIAGAVDRGTTVVITTQCRGGSVHDGAYATGAALLATGAISGGDLTFEAALTKAMVLTAEYPPATVARLMATDLAGEITVTDPVVDPATEPEVDTTSGTTERSGAPR